MLTPPTDPLNHLALPRGTRVALGMSGGVDSTVSALFLKQLGYNVVGVFMRNWDEKEETGVCTSQQEYESVQRICEHLQIPCHRVDFVREYWHEVFAELIAGYECGLTPNPDILCNHAIKFRAFLHHADSLGAHYVSTGHYARRAYDPTNNTHRLVQAVDRNKCQTYFLAGIPQAALSRVLFPVGSLLKGQVKDIARASGLAQVAEQKESMGICFVGKRKFSHFIHEYIAERPGAFVSAEGVTLQGQHTGAFTYTIGQRAGLPAHNYRAYVAGKDMARNAVVVAAAQDHPALFCNKFCITDMKWSGGVSPVDASPGGEMRCHARFRHRQELFPCVLRRIRLEEDSAGGQQDHETHVDGGSQAQASVSPDAWKTSVGYVPWIDPRAAWDARLRVCASGEDLIVLADRAHLHAVAPGQVAVFYQGGECLGKGVISSTDVSHMWQAHRDALATAARIPDQDRRMQLNKAKGTV